MTLTIQEREAIERGVLVPFVLPDSQIECVIVRRDLLDPMLAIVDDSPCPADDLLRISVEAVDAFDKDEPTPTRRRNPASIIGLWQVEHPPTDEEVDRILEEELLRKHS